VTPNSRHDTGEDEHGDSRSSSGHRHLDACVRLLHDESVIRNAGISAIGCDRVTLAFEAYDVGFDHPDVMWGMWSQGEREQITMDFSALRYPYLNDDRDWPTPLEDFWKARPVRDLRERVPHVPPPRQAPGYGRSLDEVLARVGYRAERRAEQQNKATMWPVAYYRGKWTLSDRCVVSIKLTEWVESCWAEVSFNPARLHDPEGWGVCPPELVEAYCEALLVRLANEQILVRSCPHLLAAFQSCQQPASGDSGRAQAGRVPGPKAPRAQLYRSGLVCLDRDCLAGNPLERQPVDAKIKERRRRNPKDRTRVPGPLVGVRVMQLHVTCDFTDVHDMSLPLDIMRSSRFYDPKSKRKYKESVLLSTGKSAWKLTGYDKHAESVARRQGVRAAEGTFRFEAKLMANVLRTEGLTHPATLTADEIHRVFLKGFIKAGLDRAYGGQSPVRRNRLPGESRYITRRLYRRLDARASGEDWERQDQATERGYATRAAQHGFVLGRGSRERLGPHQHLDPVEGRERPPTTVWMELHGAKRWERVPSRRLPGRDGVPTTPTR